jgi:hypothetical protein
VLHYPLEKELWSFLNDAESYINNSLLPLTGDNMFIDYTGKTFGKLTFIRKTDKKDYPKGGHYLWEIQCDCGNLIYYAASHVVRGSLKSCGCLRSKDYSGQRGGMLTFIEPTDKRQGSAVIWKAQCDCGNQTLVVPIQAIKGNITSCGCITKQKQSENGMARRKYNPIISSAKQVWHTNYKDCDFDLFFSLSQQDCHYCGRPPHRTYNCGKRRKGQISTVQNEQGDFTYNGLDRIDCSKGHISGNVVPCCTRCNQAKNNMPLAEFLELISLIYHKSIQPLEKTA